MAQFFPNNTLKTLADARYIANVPKGSKLCVATRSYITGDGWYSGIMRFFKSEDSQSTVTFVTSTIEDMCKIYREAKDNKIKQMIHTEFTSCIKGMENLSETYKDKPGTNSRLDIIIKNIKIVIGYQDPIVLADQNESKQDEDEEDIKSDIIQNAERK